MADTKAIEVLARAVIIRDGRILLCKSRGASYYFLPGGHVEFKESVVKALKREIKEEIGALLSNVKFINIVEQIYKQKGKTHHEVNLVFSGRINKSKISSLEGHIEFFWKNIKELPKINILPKQIKNYVKPK